MLLVRSGFKYVIGEQNTWVVFFCEGVLFLLLYAIMIYVFVLNAKDKAFFTQLFRKHV